MRENELLARAREAVELAQRCGASDAVASLGAGRSLEFQWRDERLEKVQENASQGLGLALYVDGRFSTHSTNDLDPRRLASFVAEAVELTRLLAPDPFRVIPDPKLYAGRPGDLLDLVDPSAVDLPRERCLEWCRLLEARARAHAEVVSATSGVMSGTSLSARVSSNGFEGTRESTGVWYGAEVTARDGEHRRPEAARWVGATHLADLERVEDVGAEALRRVLARRGATKAPTQRTHLIVDREAAPGLLGRVLGALGASAVQQKRSFLAERAGERIASPLLSITDHPLLPKLAGSRHFDGEGISARVLPIVERGVLRHFYVDTYYGRKLGWEPTTASPSNLVVELGPKSREELLRDVGEGLYVTSWLGGNANTTTGDYSFGLQGHAVRHGEIQEPISEMNVTGNFLDLLQRLVAVGNDPEKWSSFRAPTLVFEGIDFSGS
ncbi:MAG: TldD/PmbA family protein [Planctomycetes bacterium]|nr:TldD/PmbA family protein [Planctomycetota bacterium]